MARDPFNIFIARHKDDATFADRLQTQLLGYLYNMKYVQLKGPDDSLAGENVAKFIQSELRNSHFIVLIISADFMAKSAEYWELACDLHRDPNANCRIIPILARKCFYGPLGLDQMADTIMYNKDKPLYAYGEDDSPYSDFAESLIEIINQTCTKQTKKSRSPREQKKFAQLLTRLNYTEQPNQFLEAQVISKGKFSSNKAFAYLIKGKYGYGQKWLYRILRQKTKKSEIWEELEENDEVTYREIKISFNSVILKKDPKILWATLGDNLKIDNFASKEQVVNHIYNKIANTQIVVFLFEHFEVLNAEMRRTFMNTFWAEIVKGTASPTDAKKRFPIFMFLIDQDHETPICDHTFVPSNSMEWEPQRGIFLKELDDLSPEVVKDWLYENRIKISQFDPDMIQKLSQPEQLQELTNSLLKDTEGGVPERVLGQVSKQFNFRFLDILDQLAENE